MNQRTVLRTLRFLAACFYSATLVTAALGADEAPAWMREFATTKVPAYDAKVPAVVLLDEQNVTVDEGGRVSTTTRYAVRILTREGRKEALAYTVYLVNSGKVHDLRAWMIRPSGEVKKYGKNEVADIALVEHELYNESRARVVRGERDADPGAVFGYESMREDRPIFTQVDRLFQHHLPVLLSRFTLAVPAGWRAEGVAFNGKLTAQQSGSTYTWEMRNLPFIESEPASPSLAALAPRVAVSYFPSEDAKATMGKTFAGWPDVAQWLAALSEPRAVADEELAAKARALAVSGSEMDRIRAIGNYVQSVKYVAIETGLWRGGGYQPHAATDVFHKQYGDCKDKANLMRTMLQTVGISSYMVNLWSGDPMYVREEWPSPQQFNHAIIAVKLTQPTSSPAAIDHPKLGRLLFFDPTDESTLLGDIPEHEQGSLVLVDAADSGALVRMPSISASGNRVEREVEVVLSPDGSIAAKLREHAYGQSAASFRRSLRNQGTTGFTNSIEHWIASNANGAVLGKLDPADAPAENRFDLLVDFQAPHYAQSMQGRMLLFRPVVTAHSSSMRFSETTRHNPVVLHARSFQETVHAKLPAGFKIDELPNAGHLETPFGAYSCSYSAKGNDLTFTQSLTVAAGTIPADQYAGLKGFFEQVAGAEQAPVVLVRE